MNITWGVNKRGRDYLAIAKVTYRENSKTVSLSIDKETLDNISQTGYVHVGIGGGNLYMKEALSVTGFKIGFTSKRGYIRVPIRALGLTEAEAKEMVGDYKVGRFDNLIYELKKGQ